MFDDQDFLEKVSETDSLGDELFKKVEEMLKKIDKLKVSPVSHCMADLRGARKLIKDFIRENE